MKIKVLHIIIVNFVILNTLCAKEVLLRPIQFYISINGKSINEVEDNSIIIRSAIEDEVILTVNYINHTLFFEHELLQNLVSNDSIPEKLLLEFTVNEKSKKYFYQICILKGYIKKHTDSGSSMSPVSIFDFNKKENNRMKSYWFYHLDKGISKELKQKIHYGYYFEGGGFTTIPHIPYYLRAEDSKVAYPFGMILN